ncbi:DoxX family protein [Brooklawnia sp.]|uniref:DoxX family protein n=1 Tax=Brooklawnia sp. TaxID=2699740 RepID=UPI00311DBD82
MSTAIEDVIEQAARATGSEPPAPDQSRVVRASSLAGATPAVPRDPRLLQAEQAEHEARAAARDAESARAAADEAAARAAAAKAAAEKSKAELAVAREEAKAKAEAAALAVRLEREEFDGAAAAARAERQASRDERLGTVRTVAAAEPEIVTVTKRSTDQFAGSLALFLVRLALAAFAGIVGWQSLVDRQATIDAIAYVGLDPSLAGSAAWAVSIALIVVATFVLIGLGTRFFAAVLLIGAAGFMAFFRFGPFSPFLEGHFGFYGDRDVLLAVLSVVPILMGAGRFSVDAHLRHRRQKAKLAG